jgi:hypothetical protein
MKSAALQQAVYTRLSGFSALTDLVQAIYSESGAPQPSDAGDNSLFPYVIVGPFTGSPWDTDGTPGQTCIVKVNVYSRGKSDLEWRAIADQVYEALNRHDLSISGADTVDCLFQDMSSFPDPDGKTTRAVLDFRVTYGII